MGAATLGVGAAFIVGPGVALAAPGSATGDSASNGADDSGPSTASAEENGESTETATDSQAAETDTDEGDEDLDHADEGDEVEDPEDDLDDAVAEPGDDDNYDKVDDDDQAVGTVGDSAAAAYSAPMVTDEAQGDGPADQVTEDEPAQAAIEDAQTAASPGETSPTGTLPIAFTKVTEDAVTDPSATVAPVTIKSMVVDVMTWVGLGPLANALPLPAWPVPGFVESVWLAVRQHQYRWNNQRPTARPTLGAQAPDGLVSGSLNAVDFDGDSLTYSVARDPKRGTVHVDAAGNFVYTPSPALLAGGGSDRFTVTIDDRIGNPEHHYGLLGLLGLLGPTQKTIRVSIAKIANRAPIAEDPAFEFSADLETGVLTGTVNVKDPDGDPLTFHTTGIDPSEGTVVIDETTGRWAFTPSAHAQLQAWTTPGEQSTSFSILANDGRASTPITVSVPVLADAELRNTFQTIEYVGEQPVALAVSPDGRTYIASYGDGALYVIRPDGSIDDPIDIGASPFGVAVGNDGRVYVTDTAAGTVTAVDPDTRTTATFSDVSDAGALAFDSEGRAYVASAVDGTITVLNSAGVSTGRVLNVDGIVTSLAIDAAGVVIATVLSGTDNTEARLITIDADDETAVIVQFGENETPYGVGVDGDGRIYVTDLTGTLRVVTGRGSTATTTTVDFGTPLAGVAVGVDGRVYTTDILHKTLKVLTPGLAARGLYDYVVDPVTGVATGRLNVVSPDVLTYTVPSQPAAGTVTIDAATGTWVFTPTAAQRFSAWITPGPDQASFSVQATGSTTSTAVNIAVEIAPKAELLLSELAQLGVEPTGIAVTSDGRYLVTSTSVTNPSVGMLTVVNADGTIARTIDLDGPSVGVAIGTDGRVFVSDYAAGKVMVVDITGTSAATTFASVAGASALAVDSDGRVLVTSVDDGTLTILDPDGSTVKVINVGGPSAGVTVAPDGTIAVSILGTDLDGGSLLVFTPGNPVPQRITLIDVTPYGVAVGPDGRFYVADYDSAGVVIVDYDGQQRRIDTEALPFGIAVAADGSLYVTHLEAGTVSALTPVPAAAADSRVSTIFAGGAVALQAAATSANDGAGNSANGWVDRALSGPRRAAVIAEIPYTDYMEGSHGIVVSPDGKYIYAGTAHYSSSTFPTRHGLAVIDADTNTVIREIPISFDTPHGVAVSSDGRYVYVRAGQILGGQSSSGVAIVDTHDNFTVRYVSVASDFRYVGSIVGVGGHLAYASMYNGSRGVAVIDARTATVQTILDGIGGGSITASPDGSKVYVPGYVIDTATGNVLSTEYSMYRSADGRYAYSAGNYNGKAQFTVIDTVTGNTVMRIPLDKTTSSIPSGGIVLSPDGNRAYVRVQKADSPPGVVSLIAIDLNKKTVIGEVPFRGYNGDYLTVSPNGKQIYIASHKIITAINTTAITNASTAEVSSSTKPKKQPNYGNVLASFVTNLAIYVDKLSGYTDEDYIRANPGLHPAAVSFLRHGVPAILGAIDVLTGAKSIAEGTNPVTGPLRIVAGLAGAAVPHIPIFPPHMALVKATALAVGTVIPVFVSYLNEAYPDL